jgi:hypothetical protein
LVRAEETPFDSLLVPVVMTIRWRSDRRLSSPSTSGSATLGAQGEAGLTAAVTGCGEPVQDRFGLFLVCAHVSNHVGQIVYLVQAHGHRLDEKVW